MKRDIHSIVAEQLNDAQLTYEGALRIVERVQTTLNRKQVLLTQAELRLGNIEEIHNAITPE